MVNNNENSGENENNQASGDPFITSEMNLEDIPQIELPFEDDLSQNLKDLLRALVINQQNIINNCTWLYKTIKELSDTQKLLYLSERHRRNRENRSQPGTAVPDPDMASSIPQLESILEILEEDEA